MIREFAPEALVVLSADAVYALDYGALVEQHVEAGAPATMVTTAVDPDDAGRYGVVQVDGGRVRDYAYKPDDPAGDLVCNEVFVFDPGRVLDLLDERGDDNAEEDLGDTLLPPLVDAGDVREHRFDGFWRDVGTIDAYWSTHMELLAEPPPIDLDDPGWPIVTRAIGRRASARVLPGAEIAGGMLAPGSHRRRPRRALGDRPRRARRGGGDGDRLGAPPGRRGAIRSTGRARDPRRPRRRAGRARASARATATSRWSGSPSGSPPAPRCRPAGACPARTDTLRTWSPRRSTTRSPTTTT